MWLPGVKANEVESRREDPPQAHDYVCLPPPPVIALFSHRPDRLTEIPFNALKSSLDKWSSLFHFRSLITRASQSQLPQDRH